MKVLGIAAPFSHDSSAALIVDGQVVAAAEEERFTRNKHEGYIPVQAINYCLREAGLKPSDIDAIAFPWSINPLKEKRFEFFRRSVRTKPSQAFKKFFRNQKEFRDKQNFVNASLRACGFAGKQIPIHWVEHHLAHVASSFYFSGMKEASVLSIDAGGEITSTLIGKAEGLKITKMKEVIADDSLGNFYATMTDYLGFDRGDGEYKVMGMAPFGNPSKVNIDHIIRWDEKHKSYLCNDEYVWVIRPNRYRVEKVYSKKMVQEFGPEREGDDLSEPYIHIAAATQKKLEDITLKLVDTYLKDDLKRHGNLCFAGGCALNVALNRVLLELPYVKRLWVQPAAHDSGTSLGAAAFAAAQLGDTIKPMQHAYWGPQYSHEEIEQELKKWNFPYTKENDICARGAELIHRGEVLAWFQGRMEWGPRALGNRSILGNPTIKGTADRINAIIKFRELWRPFCPSILKEHAAEVLNSSHDAPYMTIAFKVNPKWKERIKEVVHVDDTCRPQIVDSETNPRFHRLISNFYQKTNVPVLINTSLNRRGEPMICSPKDALVMFEGCGLEYLAIGDFLVTKKKS
jgi:carbamoyltransferase